MEEAGEESKRQQQPRSGFCGAFFRLSSIGTYTYFYFSLFAGSGDSDKVSGRSFTNGVANNRGNKDPTRRQVKSSLSRVLTLIRRRDIALVGIERKERISCALALNIRNSFYLSIRVVTNSLNYSAGASQ